jgi:Phospholipase C
MTIITISIFLTLIRTKHTVAVTKVVTWQYGTATPIRHVVIIILENHAFDNIYGTYPFGVPPIINNITLSLVRPVGLNLSIMINGVKPYYANSVILIDPWEGLYELPC